MTVANLFDPIRSLKLISLERNLKDLITLFEKETLPNVLMISGKKGIGKFTLINHFLNYVFNKNTKTPYDLENNTINENSIFYTSVLNQACQDVIYLNLNNKKLKIDDIRNLKTLLSKKTLNLNHRFIVIDEVEFLNVNSSNALLKILEEPSKNNIFILINNNQSKVLETISSRCIINNIFLDPVSSRKIIKFLIENNNLESVIDPDTTDLTPGAFLEFNNILLQNKITLENDILETISLLLLSYKKSKNISIINLCNFLIEEHFHKMIVLDKKNIDYFLILKDKIVELLKDLVNYNLNVLSVINSIKYKLKNAK